MALFLSGCPEEIESQKRCKVTGWELIYENDSIAALTGSAPDDLYAVHEEVKDCDEYCWYTYPYHYFDSQSWSETGLEIQLGTIFSLETGTVFSANFSPNNPAGTTLITCNAGICDWELVTEYGPETVIFYPGHSWASSENDIWISGGTYEELDNEVGDTHSDLNDYFLHYDGQQWNTVWVPGYPEVCEEDSKCPANLIKAVWGRSADDVWSLVYDRNSETSKLYHYEGDHFSLILEVEEELFFLLALDSSHAYFTSIKNINPGDDEFYESKLYHFSGNELVPMIPPEDEDSIEQFRKMAGTSPSDLYLIGGGSHRYTNKVWHYDGEAWSRFDTPESETGPHESKQIFTLAPDHIYSVEEDGVHKATCESE